MTFWGNGRLNFHRAHADAITQLLSPMLTGTDIHRLADFRNERPGAPLSDLLGVLALSSETANRMMNLLTDRSGCSSLWIVRRGPGGGHVTLMVQQRPEGSKKKSVVRRFTW
jgi:hypothetical protein